MPLDERQGILCDKVVIVTGASRGIGAAAARHFASAGAVVVLAARSEPEIASLGRQIVEAGRRALAVTTDSSTTLAAVGRHRD